MVSTIRSKGMEKWIMRRKNRPYVKIEHGVLVDREVLDDRHARDLRVVFDEKRSAYPLIVNETGAVMDVLHRYTALFLFGPEKVNDERCIVHHRRANKKNCRGENLEVPRRPRAYPPAPRREERRGARCRRVLASAREEAGGGRRPRRAAPRARGRKDGARPVRPPGPLTGGEHGRPEPRPAAPRGRDDPRHRLRRSRRGDAAPRLRDRDPETKAAGSSIDETSRSLKIEPIRLGCWRSEAALVRLVASHERPDGTFDLDAAGAEVDIHPALFRHFLKRPAVAVERWRRYRRLPKASPTGWPRARAAGSR